MEKKPPPRKIVPEDLFDTVVVEVGGIQFANSKTDYTLIQNSVSPLPAKISSIFPRFALWNGRHGLPDWEPLPPSLFPHHFQTTPHLKK